DDRPEEQHHQAVGQPGLGDELDEGPVVPAEPADRLVELDPTEPGEPVAQQQDDSGGGARTEIGREAPSAAGPVEQPERADAGYRPAEQGAGELELVGRRVVSAGGGPTPE